MKHFYALYDAFIFGSNRYSHGFCNTKSVFAFTSKKDRDHFLKNIIWYDLSARAIKRNQAIKFAKNIYDLQAPVVIMRETDYFQFGVEIFKNN